ncbi:cryptochrome/photolyase family protein [Novosphingobium mangrovi (ex Hu et al. 2023)]|uniref:DNA photolyase family protein n=1 Tax=Novosphingobium mangrovi (ex Hu et al. 2023) TaxID=2930094 RepID=A0ABT0A8G8_9SPHN|nr:deoxyribodipyrimidine photo-lyase [Novosphingobium mangrovi (ex Hu et al. 2023)]MCJ1959499.1 DNA photolyase family protein [Novosphingobium mangrovi (ex Hu et al. 2023)]
MSSPVIVWFRRDLRLSDQAALVEAAAKGPVVPVYVLDDETAKHRAMGGASRWWLHHSLESLSAALEEKGSRLILRRGRCEEVLPALAKEVGASEVHALRHYEPWWRNAEKAVGKALTLHLHHGNYLAPPGSVTTGAGQPYKIFTPFWRALHERLPPPDPLYRPHTIAAPESWPESEALDDWGLLPTKPDWAGGLRDFWTPGEEGAKARLKTFAEKASRYEGQRNLPARNGTSFLSPHLHFGEISPAQVWHATSSAGGSVATFLSEIGWRDYAQNVILQYPDYGGTSAREGFDDFPWRSGAQAQEDLEAWQQGRTGYPIVDAGMRELWHTGWMHNRVRMITASFLIKHLLIDWREGEKWFWDTLVDADYASNAVNWQWNAGSGVDSNMFVRIMAPLSQSEKFDAAGYIRQWVPELADLPAGEIHDPSPMARPKGYPQKLIEHRAGRERALGAWESFKGE